MSRFCRPSGGDATRVVDKMPISFQMIGLVHDPLLDARIIPVTCDPLDICLSCYTRLLERSQLHSYDQVALGLFCNN